MPELHSRENSASQATGQNCLSQSEDRILLSSVSGRNASVSLIFCLEATEFWLGVCRRIHLPSNLPRLAKSPWIHCFLAGSIKTYSPTFKTCLNLLQVLLFVLGVWINFKNLKERHFCGRNSCRSSFCGVYFYDFAPKLQNLISEIFCVRNQSQK